ncbi:MAG: hypothetical protein J6A33_07860 [Alphaproteobacteria bacterium]|nr:hypothetical protein [Alphaproteobacteria bacterium]
MADEKPMRSFTYSTAHVGSSYSPEQVGKMLSNREKRIEKNLAEINDRLQGAMDNGEDVKAIVAEKNAIIAERNSCQKQKEMYEENPQLYSNLFAIEQNSKKSEQDLLEEQNGEKAKEPDSQTMIARGGNGEMCLAVKMQMEGSPFSFALRDGKVTFPDSEVSPEQMKMIMDFLWRRGIRDFDLPKGAEVEPKIADSFNKAKEKFDSEMVDPGMENIQGISGPGDENTPEATDEEAMLSPAERWARDNQETNHSEISAGEEGMAGNSGTSGGNSSGNTEGGSSSEGNETEKEHKSFFTKVKEVFDEPECQKKAEAHIEDMLSNGLHKRSEYSYFKRAGALRYGDFGWTVYSSYAKGNENNLKLDGKRDKDGNVNSTFEFRLYVRPNKDGKGVDVGYAMPNGKTVSSDVADEVIAIQKAQGNSHVSLKNIPNNDLGEFRKACGRALVVPVGIGLDRRKVKQMMKEAEERGTEEEILKYGYEMALQMERNALKKSKGEKELKDMNTSDAKYAAELKAAYEYTPFRNQYEGVMRKGLEGEIKDGKAENVIAAAKAVSKVYDLYENNGNWGMAVAEMSKNLPSMEREAANATGEKKKMLQDEIAKIKAAEKEIEKNPAVGNKPIREFSGEQMGMLYNAVSIGGRDQAKKDLDDALKKNRELAPEERENPNQIIRRMVSDAHDEVSEVSNRLEDNGVKRLYVPKFGTPTYDFPIRQQNNTNTNTNTNGRRSTRGGGHSR